jgi:hypothetical protein
VPEAMGEPTVLALFTDRTVASALERITPAVGMRWTWASCKQQVRQPTLTDHPDGRRAASGPGRQQLNANRVCGLSTKVVPDRSKSCRAAACNVSCRCLRRRLRPSRSAVTRPRRASDRST